MQRQPVALLLLSLTTLSVACSSTLLTRLTSTPSPREQYAESLRDADLHLSGMGADWLRLGDEVLTRPLSMTSPFRESAYFPADRPIATAYQLTLKRGRRLEIDVSVDSLDGARLFVDVFETRGADAPARVASLLEGTALRFDVPRDGVYLLRVQPELLRSGRYTLIERTLASLRVFPVEGSTPAAVQSEFGDDREAGRRQHEGIDIFAPRDTPVIAVVDGRAVPDTNTLGGNVVWLRAAGARRSFYYAHLHRWAFEEATAIAAGQVVGYVGNSGNARMTAPHLHFGIYERGAIDPLPFLAPDESVPPPPRHTDRLAQRVRVTASGAPLRAGDSRTAPPILELGRDSVAIAMGTTGSRLRVLLPDGRSGYLDNGAATVAASPLRRRRVLTAAPLRDRPLAGAPVMTTIGEGSAVQVLGRFEHFELVRTADGAEGWLDAADGQQPVVIRR